MSEYTFQTAALKAVTIDAVKYNEEGLQNSMPIAWDGNNLPSKNGTQSISIDSGAESNGGYAVTIGNGAHGDAYMDVCIGYSSNAKHNYSVVIGGMFSTDGTTYRNTQASAPQTVVIGNGAQILNPTNEDGSPVLDGNGKQIVSSNSVTIGTGAVCKNLDSVVIGASADATKSAAISIGAEASAFELEAIAIGKSASANWKAVAVGAGTVTSSSSVAIGNAAAACQYGVAIGNEAKISNTTAADGTVTQSTNSTIIGYGARASAPNAVVLGAGASTAGKNTIVIGVGNKLSTDTGTVDNTVAIGKFASTAQHTNNSVYIGSNVTAEGNICVAVGTNSSVGSAGVAVGASAKANHYSTAIGYQCANTNNGVTAFKQQYSTGETYTQFYIMAAESPLAVQYEEGEACMGYVVKNKTTGDLVAAGTQKLSALFPNNSTFQPATIDENGEWVMPKVFHPADLDLPIEEPTEPENVEMNIPEPEPEEYIPLPVYSVVEPETPEIDE